MNNRDEGRTALGAPERTDVARLLAEARAHRVMDRDEPVGAQEMFDFLTDTLRLLLRGGYTEAPEPASAAARGIAQMAERLASAGIGSRNHPPTSAGDAAGQLHAILLDAAHRARDLEAFTA